MGLSTSSLTLAGSRSTNTLPNLSAPQTCQAVRHSSGTRKRAGGISKSNVSTVAWITAGGELHQQQRKGGGGF